MTRLSDLAPILTPLRAWRDLRRCSEADGTGSNWYAAWPRPERDPELAADNDNEAPPTEIEMELCEDTAEALLRRLRSVETCIAPDGRVVIVGGDVEFSSTSGRLVRAGNLMFADFSHRVPFANTPMAGQLLGRRSASGQVVPLEVTARYRSRKTLPPAPVGPPMSTHEGVEARAELIALLAILDDRTVRVLDETLSASSLEDLGLRLGFSGEYARKAGRSALLKAASALEAAQADLQKKCAA